MEDENMPEEEKKELTIVKKCINYNDLFANKMKDTFDFIYDSIPSNYKEIINEYTSKLTIGIGIVSVITSKLKQ